MIQTIRGLAVAAELSALRAFDIFELARNHRAVSGNLSLSAMPRLLAEVLVEASAQKKPFSWQARGSVTRALGADEGGREERWLTLTISGSFYLECQRCLEPYEQALEVEALYLIVDTEEGALLMDNDEVDAIVGSQQFDLLDLIEEELLLSLPLVPKHAVCPSVHDSLLTGVDGCVSSLDGAKLESEKPNRFAALKALTVRSGGQS
jgi:uncharacterized protein